MNLITLPVRVAVAYTQATIGIAQLFAPGGPIRVVYRLADLTDEDRPLGRALARGGTVDRLLSEGGVLVQLTDSLGAAVKPLTSTVEALTDLAPRFPGLPNVLRRD